MNVFVTGASGFIGSAVVQELRSAGHQVVGLARSEASAQAIKLAGAEVLSGTLQDLDILRKGALEADGVIHTAFIHDFNNYANANEVDTLAIHAMGDALMGTTKPLVVTAGILGVTAPGVTTTEDAVSKHFFRGSEKAAMALAEQGIHASVIRLSPSVHDEGDQGFIPFIISQAIKNGVSAYPLDGENRWPAVHRKDAARLFRLALEHAQRGDVYHGVGDQGILVKAIASLIAEKLDLPLASISGDALAGHFEWMQTFIQFDTPASAGITQSKLGWQPTEIGLLEDMKMNYFNF